MPEYATESRLTQYGIVLALYPSTVAAGIEIQRAPDSGGAADTGNAESIAVVPPGQRTFTDLRGGGTWWYRIRHVFAGATASSWTDWVSGTPTQIPPVLPQIPDVGGWIIKQGKLESTDGNITLDAPNETITIGSATAPLTGTGIFLGSDGASGYDMRAGDPSGQYMHWDASTSTLKVEGILEASGVRYGPLHADASARTVSGTTTETTLESITIPQGAMGSGGGLKAEFWLTLNGASSGNSTRTLRLDWGGTTFFAESIGAVDNIVPENLKVELVLANTSASTQVMRTLFINDEDTPLLAIFQASGSQDTSAGDVDLDITMQHDGSAAGDSTTLQFSRVELVSDGV